MSQDVLNLTDMMMILIRIYTAEAYTRKRSNAISFLIVTIEHRQHGSTFSKQSVGCFDTLCLFISNSGQRYEHKLI